MFLLNSFLGLFSAAWSPRLPFSRSYWAILPSSLAMLLPSAVGSSPHPPVSVYGTGMQYTIAAFLDGSSTLFATYCSLPVTGSLYEGAFPPPQIPRLDPAPSRARASSPCPHSSDTAWCRNINLLSIGYAFRPDLRSRLPQGRSALPWNPWIFGLGDSHPHLATHSGILPSWTSTALYSTASVIHQCSPTNVYLHS